MKPVLEQSEHPLTAKDLEELEARLGRPLPPAFKEYYLCYNGGYLPEDREGNALIVGGFDSVRYGQLPAEQLYADLLESFEQLYADLLESFEQLEMLFPFAYDQGGNNFLISLRDQPDYGSIYIWLMDLQELQRVAESFADFLDFLQEE